MKTLYDIGDEIKITLEGKVIEYSASKDGDCYIIELSDPKQKKNRVYLSSDDLKGNSSKLDDSTKPYDYFMDPLGRLDGRILSSM